MVVSKLQIQKRKRGVILSSQGWQRLQAAEHLISIRENESKPFTLEQLSDRTSLSTKTVTKVRRRQKPVDQPTLEAYFEAFDLTLGSDDCIGQDLEPLHPSTGMQQVPLRGQIPVDSLLYVYRPPIEQICLNEIMNPGALIRIKAPRQFGKTSLMARMLGQAEDQGLRTAVLSLRMADRSVLQTLDGFLQWFCASASRSLGLPNRIDDYWNQPFGSSYCCADYFESYLLPASEAPLLLAIDDVDVLFHHPEIATDFFGMLRAWYEQARHGIAASHVWQNLRLVILHSTEVLLRLSLHQSPFNVGILVDLPSFNCEQVQNLALRYDLPPTQVQADQLVEWVGGNPYLVQLVLHHLSAYDLSLQDVLGTAIAPDGVLGSYLRQLLGCLDENPQLGDAIVALTEQPQGVELHPEDAFQLYGLGLLKFDGRIATFNGSLHQHYFSQMAGLLQSRDMT
ncbi:MAG: AAA-like domain-containing protein [Kaiparowitsia implicata GSE-PSE-MK54-09C]|nr:AAA-like domain-containing protein [Kaiparowitsia implicata GSE-PSE-MK54-09C]